MNPIFEKEIEAFEELCIGENGLLIDNTSERYHELESFLLSSLQRASMAVVEHSMVDIPENNCVATFTRAIRDMQIKEVTKYRSDVLAKAREITGVKEN